MIFLLDNYDSFTFNLVQRIGEIDPAADIRVERNDQITVEQIEDLKPERIIISPGPCTPAEVVRANRLMHGKTSLISHTGQGVFAGLPDPFQATRYHSLIVPRETVPDCLQITAWVEDPGQSFEVMGLQHREYPVHGVQFHPESFLTEKGYDLLRNFLAI